MKVAISADGRDVAESNVTTFCGCDFFLIIDTKTNSLKTIENENKGLPSEVGGTAGQLVSNQGIDAVIASLIGPQAMDIFGRYGIKVYYGEGKIDDVIRQLDEKGRLPEITKAALKRYKNLKGENDDSESD
jgi:predicted Fe-Mo cluster-binding NifX family protein